MRSSEKNNRQNFCFACWEYIKSARGRCQLRVWSKCDKSEKTLKTGMLNQNWSALSVPASVTNPAHLLPIYHTGRKLPCIGENGLVWVHFAYTPRHIYLGSLQKSSCTKSECSLATFELWIMRFSTVNFGTKAFPSCKGINHEQPTDRF